LGLGFRVTPARRLAFFLGVDTILALLAGLAAVAIRFDGTLPRAVLDVLVPTAPAFVGLTLAALGLARVYSVAWSFVGLRDVGRIAAAIAMATVVMFILATLAQSYDALRGLPRSVIVLQAPLSFLAISGFRLSKRAWRFARKQPAAVREARAPTIIVGAGQAGKQVLESINDPESRAQYRVVGFVDDDPLAWGTSIHGAPVLGPIKDLGAQVARTGARAVIICIAHATGPLVRSVTDASREAGVEDIRIIPPLTHVIDGTVTVQSTRVVSLEDLLGRAVVRIDDDAVRGLIMGRRVLVTGGAGTIGTELCSQVHRLAPTRLTILDVDETRLHEAVEELRERGGTATTVDGALVDVRDARAVEAVLEEGYDLVFHAAAYKHVPMMEDRPVAALHVNVIGTSIVLHAARAHGCSNFVLISTDKAVEPSSVMGASKRLAELVALAPRATPERADRTRCSIVRFGNVVGSRGSVIPTFERQLKHGGPLTVTHPDMERFFMMTSEAVALVLQAAALGDGRDLFVLDMGKPVRIVDVAREFVRLHGLKPDVDVPIVFTGLRPGEKLAEALHYPEERLRPTTHPRVLRAQMSHPTEDADSLLATIRALVEERDEVAAGAFFHKMFPSLATRPPAKD
jgi:FlaA1/EpsC-like NDP-sugar epimerase